MGHGPARPINVSEDGLPPCPAYHRVNISPAWPGRPSLSNLQKSRPGPVRPMILTARPMRKGPYTGRPAFFVGRPVELTGRLMCCHAHRLHADMYFNCNFVLFSSIWIPWASCFRPMRYILHTHKYPLPTQFCFTNSQVRWLPSRRVDHHPFCRCDARSSSSRAAAAAERQQHLLLQHLLLQYPLLQHLLSICHPKSANITAVIFWRGLATTAEVLIARSITTHTQR